MKPYIIDDRDIVTANVSALFSILRFLPLCIKGGWNIKVALLL